jgi:hypothetical protein
MYVYARGKDERAHVLLIRWPAGAMPCKKVFKDLGWHVMRREGGLGREHLRLRTNIPVIDLALKLLLLPFGVL